MSKRNSKLFVIVAVFVILTLALAACVPNEDKPTPQKPTLSSITLDVTGAKTTYNVGDKFTADGVKVTAHMSDETTSEVALADCTVSTPDMATEGTKKVTVTYQGKTAEYDIAVNAVVVEPTLSSITLDVMSAKTTYNVGDKFTADGVKVTAHMSDETTSEIALADCTVSTPDMATEGTKKVTVTYQGKTAEYDITVNAVVVEPTLSSITLDVTGAKTVYEEGEEFTADGVKVTAHMSDETTSEVALADCTVSTPDMTTEGTKKVTVTYQGKTAEYDITVNAAPKYVVKFNTLGGSEIADVISDGKTVKLPADPTKEGYSFGGWYYNYAATKAFDNDELATKPLTTDVTLWALWNQTTEVTYTFQAEEAICNGKSKIEYPEAQWASVVSGGKYISCKPMNNGDTFTFDIWSAKDTQATLKIIQNKPDPFTFEDKFTLAVNGTAITVGKVQGNGWGGNTYTNFGGSVDVNVSLVKGSNTIVLTVVNKDEKETNFDCIKIVTTDSVVRLNRGFQYVMEAEDAELPDGAMIETPDVNGNKVASGEKSVGGLSTAGQTVKFVFNSDDATKAVVGIDLNRADPINFEDVFILKVNGVQVTIGNTNLGYWDGSTPYYCFGHLILADIDLKAGENVIELVVGSGDIGGGKTNLDRIVVFSDSYVTAAAAK